VKTLVILGLFLLVSAPAVGQLAPWWVSDAECQKEIISGGYVHTITAIAPLTLSMVPYFASFSGYYEERYALNEDGDLCRTRDEWLDPALSHSPQWQDWETPLKILDYPLTTGKTWTSESRNRLNSSGLWRTVNLTGTVVGPKVVETGIGQLDVIEVIIDYFYHYGQNTITYLLHDQLGDVTNLVSFTGCETVATEDVSWGSIKSIYR